MSEAEKVALIEQIATSALSVIGDYVGSREALRAIVAVANDFPDEEEPVDDDEQEWKWLQKRADRVFRSAEEAVSLESTP